MSVTILDILSLSPPFDPGPANVPGFRLYDGASGHLIASWAVDDVRTGPTSFATLIADLELTEGLWTLELSYVNEYGCESERASIQVQIGAGGEVDTRMRGPQNVTAAAIVAGGIRVAWGIESNASGRSNPAEFEVAFEDDPSTIVVTVTFNPQTAQYSTVITGIGHDLTKVVMVRASDGVDQFGPWVAALPVVTDAEGPAAPTLVEQTASCF